IIDVRLNWIEIDDGNTALQIKIHPIHPRNVLEGLLQNGQIFGLQVLNGNNSSFGWHGTRLILNLAKVGANRNRNRLRGDVQRKFSDQARGNIEDGRFQRPRNSFNLGASQVSLGLIQGVEVGNFAWKDRPSALESLSALSMSVRMSSSLMLPSSLNALYEES